jgi:hypothetical protein
LASPEDPQDDLALGYEPAVAASDVSFAHPAKWRDARIVRVIN